MLSIVCKNFISSVDGGWSAGTWEECSVECGGGIQYFARTCTNPAPANGGEYCVGGRRINPRECNTQPCPGIILLSSVFKKQWCNCSKGIDLLAILSYVLIRRLCFCLRVTCCLVSGFF